MVTAGCRVGHLSYYPTCFEDAFSFGVWHSGIILANANGYNLQGANGDMFWRPNIQWWWVGHQCNLVLRAPYRVPTYLPVTTVPPQLVRVAS